MKTHDEIRKYFFDSLNHVLRRLSMWGGEVTAGLFLSHLAFIEGREAELRAHLDAMHVSGMWSASGVWGRIADTTGDHASDAAIGSVYADVAFQMGYLATDRILGRAEFDSLKSEIRKSCRTRDFTTHQVRETFGPPSWGDVSNPFCPACFLYITDQPGCGVVAFDFWNEFDHDDKTGKNRGKYGDLPVLIDVRIRDNKRCYNWEFTPQGRLITQAATARR